MTQAPIARAPAETDRVETDRVETEPVETESVETESVETEPVETEPAETDPLTRKVISVIAKAQDLPEDSITADSTFEELGFDSLDGFEILFTLEEEFDLMISDAEARDITSIREAVDCVRPLLPEAAVEDDDDG